MFGLLSVSLEKANRMSAFPFLSLSECRLRTRPSLRMALLAWAQSKLRFRRITSVKRGEGRVFTLAYFILSPGVIWHTPFMSAVESTRACNADCSRRYDLQMRMAKCR